MADQEARSESRLDQPRDVSAESLVLAFQAGSNEEAEVVRATLVASGIRAVLLSDTVNPVLGGLDAPMRDTAGLGVFVMPADLSAALTVLAAPSPTDEELGDEAVEAASQIGHSSDN